MTHKDQGTGSWKNKRDTHQKPVPKGPQPPKSHGKDESYIKPKRRTDKK